MKFYLNVQRIREEIVVTMTIAKQINDATSDIRKMKNLENCPLNVL